MAAFGLHKQGGTFRAFLAEAALAKGDEVRARAEATLALKACVEADFPFGAAWAERVLAHSAAAHGESDAALGRFDRAEATFERIGAKLEQARTRRERARISAPR